jgi:D-lactate dehydrogenase (cytochrome)
VRSGTDVAVPISQFPVIVSYAAEASAELNLITSIVGHAGDGNLHTLSLFSPDDIKSQKNVSIFNNRLVAKAIELGGTCSGEHGIGIGKLKYMQQEHGVAAIDVMGQLKTMFDPNNILNPGKVV